MNCKLPKSYQMPGPNWPDPLRTAGTYTDFSGNLIPTACNDVVGSLNLLTGVLGYASYGYLVIPASAYLYVKLMRATTDL